MARTGFYAEEFLEITDVDAQDGLRVLQGTAAPGGDAGIQDAAAIGSLFLRQNGTSSAIYQKTANAGSTADWTENEASAGVTIDELSWRNETVRAATNDTLSAGSVDPSSFSDNESGLDGNDFTVGEYLLSDVDSNSPLLWEVTVVTGAADITIAAAGQALASNDTFVVQVYLPDSPAAQEAQAIVHFPSAGGPAVKIADVNWNLADGINMASGYAAQNGTISSADTVNSAIEKLDGNQLDHLTADGLSAGDVNYGTFTGDSLADNQTGKQLYQRIETLLEYMKGGEVTGITTSTAIDTVAVADVSACKWLVEIFEEATPANRKAFEVWAINNEGLDNSSDETVYAKLKLGSNFNADVTVQVAGANMNLRVSSSTAGVTARFRRISVLDTDA